MMILHRIQQSLILLKNTRMISKKNLLQQKEEQAKAAAQNALIDQIVESSEMDIPDAMVDFQVDQMVDEFKQRLAYQGLSLEQYVQFSGQSMDALRESMKGDAVKESTGKPCS